MMGCFKKEKTLVFLLSCIFFASSVFAADPNNPTNLETNSSVFGGGNFTNETIDLNFVYSDPDSELGIAGITVYNNSVAMFMLTVNGMSSGQSQVVQVHQGNFSGANINNNITWSVNVSDGAGNNTGGDIFVGHDYIFRNAEPGRVGDLSNATQDEDFSTLDNLMKKLEDKRIDTSNVFIKFISRIKSIL